MVNAAQADHQHAFAGQAAPDPFDGDAQGFAQFFAACEFGWGCASTGGNRVGDRVLGAGL